MHTLVCPFVDVLDSVASNISTMALFLSRIAHVSAVSPAYIFDTQPEEDLKFEYHHSIFCFWLADPA